MSARAVRDERGTVLYYEGTVEEITERVQAYQRLERRVEERTREMQRHRRELEALYRADEQLYRYLDLDKVLQALVDAVTDILEADKSDVMVWDPEIERLVISERTARTHGSNIPDKLHLANRTQAALYALRGELRTSIRVRGDDTTGKCPGPGEGAPAGFPAASRSRQHYVICLGLPAFCRTKCRFESGPFVVGEIQPLPDVSREETRQNGWTNTQRVEGQMDETIPQKRASALVVIRSGPLRDGLRALMSTIPQIEMVKEVNDAESAVLAALSDPPGVVFPDASLLREELAPLLGRIRSTSPGTRCFVLAGDVSQQQVALEAGADAVLLEGAQAATVGATIERLLRERATGG